MARGSSCLCDPAEHTPGCCALAFTRLVRIDRSAMDDVLENCQASFGPPPRTHSPWTHWRHLRVKRPLWAYLHWRDQISVVFRHRHEVFQDGVVVWAHLIQANNSLFKRGKIDHGGEIVYSLENPNAATPQYLEQVARRLFALKGTKPVQNDLRFIADYLTDEHTRVYGLPVPSELSPRAKCLISTTYFSRRQLPDRRLRAAFFPVVVLPFEPHVALPMPKKYWPQSFVRWWLS